MHSTPAANLPPRSSRAAMAGGGGGAGQRDRICALYF